MIRYKRAVPVVKYTLLGHPFKVWREEPLMPRFDDRFLDCSLYLYPTVQDASRGERIGGSGFLAVVDGIVAGQAMEQAGLSDEEYVQQYFHYYAVSNRHVVLRHPVVRLNTHDGGFDVIPLDFADWTHTKDQDIAVAPLSYNPAHKYLFVSVVSKFLTEAIAASHDIGIGDEVFMVGRLVNHDGKQRNSPSVRWGHISMMPFEPVFHPSNDPREQRSFLVEVHSNFGYSGSPVFVRPLPTCKLLTHPDPLKEGEVRTSLSANTRELHGGPWLLGVDWGYINCHDQRQNNTGVSGVVPAWHVTNLLNTERLRRQREQEQGEREERRRRGGVTLTASGNPGEPG